MKKVLFVAIAALMVAAFAGSARAQLIVNASFESPAGTSPGSPFDVTSNSDTAAPLITGWTAAMSDPNNNNPYGLVNNSVLTTPGTSSGSQSAYMQVYYNYTNSTLTTTNSLGPILPNSTYVLTVALGAPSAASTFDGVSGTVGETAAQEDISLLANGIAVVTTTVANTSVPVGTLSDYTVSFTTGASGGYIGDALTIQLEADKAFYPGGNPDPGSEAAIFDNVRLVVLPEPSTWALLLGGLGFLALLARRKLRKA